MYTRFEALLKKHNTTAYKVSKETGISRSTFSEWKKGSYEPKADKIQKIADHFGVTVAYLMGWEEETIEAVAEEQEAALQGMEEFDMFRYALANCGRFDGVEWSDKEIMKLIKYAKFILDEREDRD